MTFKKNNLRKMISYYKPYMGMFWADMFFATLSSGVALSIPLVVRYVTSTLVYQSPEVILNQTIKIAILLAILVVVDFGSRFFIGNYGHVMGLEFTI